MKRRKGKNESSQHINAVECLGYLRKEALEVKDPAVKRTKIDEILAFKPPLHPALSIATAVRIAFQHGLDMLLALDFSGDDVKQTGATQQSDCFTPFWNLAYQNALNGTLTTIPWVQGMRLRDTGETSTSHRCRC